MDGVYDTVKAGGSAHLPYAFPSALCQPTQNAWHY
jgi:hypothetical protein